MPRARLGGSWQRRTGRATAAAAAAAAGARSSTVPGLLPRACGAGSRPERLHRCKAATSPPPLPEAIGVMLTADMISHAGVARGHRPPTPLDRACPEWNQSAYSCMPGPHAQCHAGGVHARRRLATPLLTSLSLAVRRRWPAPAPAAQSNCIIALHRPVDRVYPLRPRTSSTSGRDDGRLQRARVGAAPTATAVRGLGYPRTPGNPSLPVRAGGPPRGALQCAARQAAGWTLLVD